MPEIIPIQDLNDPALQVYTQLNEKALQHYYEPQPEGLFIAESPAVIERALDAGYEVVSLLLEEKYVRTQARPILERIPAVPVYVAPLEVLSGLTGYHLNRGILGAFRRKELPLAETLCQRASRIVILDNIENPTNVGAIFRNAAALGMDAVLMTPSSADPLQRRAIRVSVGTVFQIPWTYIGVRLTAAHARAKGLPVTDLSGSMEASIPAWPDGGIQQLHQLGFRIAAMALHHDTIPIDDPRLRQAEKLAIVLGNEGSGLPEHTLALCDDTVKIPMSHGVDSLNVAAASAVTFWELGKHGGSDRNELPSCTG